MPDHVPAIAQAERRLHQRFPVHLPIRLEPEHPTGPLLVETTNLSISGCCVSIANQLPVGTRVRAELQFEDMRIGISGRIITRHPLFGNGIMFLKFEKDGEDRLRRFLQGLGS